MASGQVKVGVLGMAPSLPHIKSGKLVALAVTGAAAFAAAARRADGGRVSLPGFETAQWQGFAAPAGTPPAIIERMHDELVRIMSTPAVIERLAVDRHGQFDQPHARRFHANDREPSSQRWPAVVSSWPASNRE